MSQHKHNLNRPKGVSEIDRSLMDARRQRVRTAYIFVGEGEEKGPAYNLAKRLLDSGSPDRIVIVDPQKPAYELLPNMSCVQRDAISYFEGFAPESVGQVRDDFAYEHISYGMRGDPRKEFEVIRTMLSAEIIGGPVPKSVKNLHMLANKYIKGVYRALEPGGQFILTTSDVKGGDTLKLMMNGLEKAGFDVGLDVIKPEDVMANESSQAKISLQNGDTVYRIIAEKPKGKKPGELPKPSKPRLLDELMGLPPIR